jgi:ribulose-phosphate 3-epimerase
MIEVVPAIIAKDFGDLEERVGLIEPYVARAQLDIMDGSFVDNETMKGFDELAKLETNLKFEVHLMVDDPLSYVEQFLKTDKVDKYILHVESEGNLNNVITMIRQAGREVGLSLNPQTPNEVLTDYLEKISFIQFMTVDPGFYGSPFVEDVLDKMTDFHYMYPNVPMQVDGGVNEETAHKVVEAGATTLVSGSYIFNSDDVSEAIYMLQRTGD